jgi:chemotaxis protein MotB
VRKKRKPHEEEHVDETWLIPYSDLLTLLLALFIVLFAVSQIDISKFDELKKSLNAALNGGVGFFEASTVPPISENAVNLSTDRNRGDFDSEERERIEAFLQETAELQQLKRQLDIYISKNGLTSQLETQLNDKELLITISDNTLFDSGSAAVKPEAQRLAVAISDMLDDYPQFEIIVAGHTDNVPIHTAEFPSNWDLSAKRALNFMKYLLQNENIRPERFRSIGYGEYRPVASNETAEGRAKNRRVEVSIVRNITSDENVETASLPLPAENSGQ